MKPLNFFIFFHDTTFQENTSDFTSQELSNMFTWFAVNEKIPKRNLSWIPPDSLLYEYKLKIHSPLYQMLNFYQNSAFFHLYWNKELINSKYIGFGQYDMKMSAPSMRELYSLIENDTADKVIIAFPYSINYLSSDLIPPHSWVTTFFTPYNEYYGTSHTLKTIETLPLALLHTFIIPTWFFLHMMPFVEHLLPRILETLQWDTRHLAGTLERVFALCISCAITEGKFRHILKLEGIEHVDNQHSEDILRGIAAGSQHSLK
jgi:hypothetical protein